MGPYLCVRGLGSLDHRPPATSSYPHTVLFTISSDSNQIPPPTPHPPPPTPHPRIETRYIG